MPVTSLCVLSFFGFSTGHQLGPPTPWPHEVAVKFQVLPLDESTESHWVQPSAKSQIQRHYRPHFMGKQPETRDVKWLFEGSWGINSGGTLRTQFWGAEAVTLPLHHITSPISAKGNLYCVHYVPDTVRTPSQFHHLLLTISLVLSLASFPTGDERDTEKLSNSSKFTCPGGRPRSPTQAVSLWKPRS